MKPIMKLRDIGARLLVPVVAGSLLVGLAACEVKNPGAILDEDLNDELVIGALVIGVSADLSTHVDELAFLFARSSDEMTGSGSYFSTGSYRRGIWDRDDMDGYWERAHRARWVAEDAIRRMDSIGTGFQGTEFRARANLLAGIANRMLAEDMCFCVLDSVSAALVGVEAGAPVARTKHAELAILEFTEAVSQGQSAGTPDIVTAAHGGLAQAMVAMGNFTGALAEAALVPTDFVYEAIYSDNSAREQNEVWDETLDRPEMSAFGVLAGTFDPPDPRAPYVDCTVSPKPHSRCSTKGADGLTPHYMQLKYPKQGSNVPVIKGTEMRLIEAEERWIAGDIPGTMAKINEARNFYGLPDLPDPATLAATFDVLDDERHLTLWLEGRRIFDLRRWDHPFLMGGGNIYPGVANRADCIPISLSECQTNPKLSGAPECEGPGEGS